MSRFLAIAGLLLVVYFPAKVNAQDVAPERLLSADSLIYLRFDGLDAHRKAYEQTVLGELMQGDLGNLVGYVATVLKDSLGPVLAKEKLLGGSDSDSLKRVQKGFNHLPEVLNHLSKQGIVVGVEADPTAFRIQLTVVFPEGGDAKNRDGMLAFIGMIPALAKIPVKETNAEGRTIFTLDPKATAPVRVGWWQEGKHMVLVVGTADPTATLALASGKKKSLLDTPLYKSLGEFKKYETAGRGFVDFERALKMAALYPPGQQLMAKLGLANLKHLEMHVGFEGKNQRSTFVLHVPGPRTGLLSGLAGLPGMSLQKLPPMPPDATGIQTLHLELSPVYDTVLQAIAMIIEVVDSDEKVTVEELTKRVNQAVGVDVRKDLLGTLGNVAVLYSSPSEGILALNFGLAVQVKDAKKLGESLQSIFQSLPAATGMDISIKKQVYQDAEINTLRVTQQGFFILPSYAIHKDWLVVGLFPQTVQGYVMRASGKYSTWKPTALLGEVLATATKDNPNARVLGISVSDPRPTIKQLCGMGPFIAGMADSFAPGSFDPSKIPNGQAITEKLYPNVSVALDDGDSIRSESYSSFSMPFEMTGGWDAYILFVFTFAFRVAG